MPLLLRPRSDLVRHRRVADQGRCIMIYSFKLGRCPHVAFYLATGDRQAWSFYEDRILHCDHGYLWRSMHS